VDTTFRSILVGDDGTEEAKRALVIASSLARCCSARVVVASVIEDPSAEQQAEGYGLEDHEGSERRVRKTLEDAASKLAQSGLSVETRLLRGEAEKALANLATREGCDLIVIGHRHISRFRRWLEGSTSSALLRDTNTSLLIVH
jgi:nucleotide-binding universal stress UspA family protein